MCVSTVLIEDTRVEVALSCEVQRRRDVESVEEELRDLSVVCLSVMDSIPRYVTRRIGTG